MAEPLCTLRWTSGAKTKALSPSRWGVQTIPNIREGIREGIWKNAPQGARTVMLDPCTAAGICTLHSLFCKTILLCRHMNVFIMIMIMIMIITIMIIINDVVDHLNFRHYPLKHATCGSHVNGTFLCNAERFIVTQNVLLRVRVVFYLRFP